MITLARLRRLARADKIMNQQQLLLEMHGQLILDQHQEIRALKLEHAREMRGLVSCWLINAETPEVDMREELAQLERALAHSAAVLEEHIL
jgi:hypothetical protein